MKNKSMEFMAWRKSPIINAGMWFRVFGFGLHVIDANGYEPLFSERYGHKKALYLFGWRFSVLRPGRTA